MLFWMGITTLFLSGLLLYLCIKKQKPKVIAVSGILMSIMLILQSITAGN